MVRLVSPPILAVGVAVALLAVACGSDASSPGVAEAGGFNATSGSDTSVDSTEVTSSGPDSSTDTTRETDSTVDSVPIAAVAATEFANAAMADLNAESHLASAAFDDPDRGAPFDPGVLAARFIELQAFAGFVTSVQPSTTAYPDSDPELAPSCGRSVDLYCQVDLIDSTGGARASVVVYWFDDGVTDFSIITRSSSGAANGIGGAVCGPGFELLHGGHTPDRFDIAVCIDGTGAVQYNGMIRNTELGIQLEACQEGAEQWVALNEGFRYLVDGSISATRSSVDVFDPDGILIQSGPFTSVTFSPSTTPTRC